jgi:hypothetical protein
VEAEPAGEDLDEEMADELRAIEEGNDADDAEEEAQLKGEDANEQDLSFVHSAIRQTPAKKR